jgi:hypothetical protein
MARKRQKDRIQRTVHLRKRVDEYVEDQRKKQEFDISYSAMVDILIYRGMKNAEL